MTKLKPKNREKLERWYSDYIFNCLTHEEDYRWQVTIDGLTGVNELSNEELLTEYKIYLEQIGLWGTI